MANLTDAQVDALCEMGSIGSGNAATALSQLISELIHISVPAVKLLPINQVAEVLGGAGKETYIIYLDVESKVSGTMVTILSP
ncbi:MAG: chemotaxis protein CheC, partial [Candidatus Heimdallarchaeota archaeon]|nr:chemotaxis protein CheC [Candidatus Heimdallarchaeota archaeon]